MLIIGDRIDATRRYVAQAVLTENRGFIQSEVMDQAVSGADYINLNAAIFGKDEEKRLRWMIGAVQEVTDLPLCIDSPNPAVIEKVLPLVQKRPIINAITLEAGRMEPLLRLVIKHGAKVIASCQAGDSAAETTADKVAIAGRLIRLITDAGVPADDLYIDPLAYSLSTNTQAARATLSAIEQIMIKFSGVHTTCCLSTVSYGLPARNLLHRTFLTAAMERGLDSAIIDPTDSKLSAVIVAGRLISGREECSLNYIRAFREGRLE
jgi:5-methyltetrahydrofolate corrinoid/iron sulfur protein methyltransferase